MLLSLPTDMSCFVRTSNAGRVVYGVARFVDSGERFCLVGDRRIGLPLHYLNLYLTTQLRNKEASTTIEAAAGHLVATTAFFTQASH